MFKAPEIKELFGLNAHNAKVFSGIEYVYVAILNISDRINLIRLVRKCVQRQDPLVSISLNDMHAGVPVSDETDEEKQKKDLEIFNNVIAIPINPKKSSFKTNTQGSIFGKTYANELNIFVPGMARVTAEFFNTLLDSQYAIIFKDYNGNYRMIFDEVLPIELDYEQNSGEGLAGEAGFTATFKNESKLPPLYVYAKMHVGSFLHTQNGETTVGNMATILTGPNCEDQNIIISQAPGMTGAPWEDSI